MKVVGLFAGVGGLEEGLRRSEHETLLVSEIDNAASLVLAEHFGPEKLHGDVLTLARLPDETELLAAGFPCQDLSQAGQMAGIWGSRSGLVRRVFEFLDQKPVPWVLLENVPNMLHLHGGAAITHVVEQFEKRGYAWAYRVIDSRAFGLPQRRRRVFVLASRDGNPAAALLGSSETPPPEGRSEKIDAWAYGFYWTEGNTGVGWTKNAVPPLKGGSSLGIPSAPAIWIPSRPAEEAFVVPGIEDGERLQGFPRGWTEAGSRRVGFRWKMVGNAVSVPVAKWIGQRLTSPGVAPKGLAFGKRWPDAAFGSSAGRYRADVSSWPVAHKMAPLEDVLLSPQALSLGAAEGFFTRLKKSSLWTPGAFVKALSKYVDHAKAASTPNTRRIRPAA